MGIRHLLVSARPQTSDLPKAHVLNQGAMEILEDAGVAAEIEQRSGPAASMAATAPATVHAGIDGEAADLIGPFLFAIRPALLRVRISRRHPGTSPSGRFAGGMPAPVPVRRGPGGSRHFPPSA